MIIEIIRNEHKYRYVTCPICYSGLKIEKDSIDWQYRKGYKVATVNCPCCGKTFKIHQ